MDKTASIKFFHAAIDRTALELQGLFTDAELETIIKAMQNTRLTPETASTQLYGACDVLARFGWVAMRKRVHIADFLSKILSLTSFQCIYLELWACQYWRQPDTTIEQHLYQLQKIPASSIH